MKINKLNFNIQKLHLQVTLLTIVIVRYNIQRLHKEVAIHKNLGFNSFRVLDERGQNEIYWEKGKDKVVSLCKAHGKLGNIA